MQNKCLTKGHDSEDRKNSYALGISSPPYKVQQARMSSSGLVRYVIKYKRH